MGTMGSKFTQSAIIMYLGEAQKHKMNQSMFIRNSAAYYYDYLISLPLEPNRNTNAKIHTNKTEYIVNGDPDQEQKDKGFKNSEKFYAVEFLDPKLIKERQQKAAQIGDAIGGAILLISILLKK